MMAHGDAQEEK